VHTAVSERIGGDVEDPHQQGTRPQPKGLAAWEGNGEGRAGGHWRLSDLVIQ
jgi:hypothetical protein